MQDGFLLSLVIEFGKFGKSKCQRSVTHQLWLHESESVSVNFVFYSAVRLICGILLWCYHNAVLLFYKTVSVSCITKNFHLALINFNHISATFILKSGKKLQMLLNVMSTMHANEHQNEMCDINIMGCSKYANVHPQSPGGKRKTKQTKRKEVCFYNCTQMSCVLSLV